MEILQRRKFQEPLGTNNRLRRLKLEIRECPCVCSGDGADQGISFGTQES